MQKQKLVVVGNGMAGIRTVEELLKLAPDGRVRWHRDYWDAAGELYEKLPVIGAVMRWLRHQMG